MNDPETIAAAAASRAPEAVEAVRRAVNEAFERWLHEASQSDEPIVVRDLELAVAEHVELARLTELGRPVLLLAPGRSERNLARLYATGPHDGLPLPPAVAPRDATWVLDADSESGIPAQRTRGDRETA